MPKVKFREIAAMTSRIREEDSEEHFYVTEAEQKICLYITNGQTVIGDSEFVEVSEDLLVGLESESELSDEQQLAIVECQKIVRNGIERLIDVLKYAMGYIRWEKDVSYRKDAHQYSTDGKTWKVISHEGELSATFSTDSHPRFDYVAVPFIQEMLDSPSMLLETALFHLHRARNQNSSPKHAIIDACIAAGWHRFAVLRVPVCASTRADSWTRRENQSLTSKNAAPNRNTPTQKNVTPPPPPSSPKFSILNSQFSIPLPRRPARFPSAAPPQNPQIRAQSKPPIPSPGCAPERPSENLRKSLDFSSIRGANSRFLMQNLRKPSENRQKKSRATFENQSEKILKISPNPTLPARPNPLPDQPHRRTKYFPKRPSPPPKRPLFAIPIPPAKNPRRHTSPQPQPPSVIRDKFVPLPHHTPNVFFPQTKETTPAPEF